MNSYTSVRKLPAVGGASRRLTLPKRHHNGEPFDASIDQSRSSARITRAGLQGSLYRELQLLERLRQLLERPNVSAESLGDGFPSSVANADPCRLGLESIVEAGDAITGPAPAAPPDRLQRGNSDVTHGASLPYAGGFKANDNVTVRMNGHF